MIATMHTDGSRDERPKRSRSRRGRRFSVITWRTGAALNTLIAITTVISAICLLELPHIHKTVSTNSPNRWRLARSAAQA